MCQPVALICYCTGAVCHLINTQRTVESIILIMLNKAKSSTILYAIYWLLLILMLCFCKRTKMLLVLPIDLKTKQKKLWCYQIFVARRITSSARRSTSASDWLLLVVTWQPSEGLQTLYLFSRIYRKADHVFYWQPATLAALHPSPERMSTRTLPLLFINLGGEMLYILDQRLRAQNIPSDKAKKGRWQLICHGADEASQTLYYGLWSF